MYGPSLPLPHPRRFGSDAVARVGAAAAAASSFPLRCAKRLTSKSPSYVEKWPSTAHGGGVMQSECVGGQDPGRKDGTLWPEKWASLD